MRRSRSDAENPWHHTREASIVRTVNNEELHRASGFLSLVLRHDPAKARVTPA